MPLDWSVLGIWNPNLNPTAGSDFVSLASLTFAETVKSSKSLVELPVIRNGMDDGPWELIARKFWIVPSTWISTLEAKPVRRRISPTRVMSPRRPESGNLAFWIKSTPTESSIVPCGVMSTSSVIKGLCCAAAGFAAQIIASKGKKIYAAKRFTSEILASNRKNVNNRNCRFGQSASNLAKLHSGKIWLSFPEENEMSDSGRRLVARRFFIGGLVQGVGFRYFTQRSAAKHQVKGYVRNLPDGRVEIFAQGEERAVNSFRDDIAAGPAFAKVEEIEEIVLDPDPGFTDFRIEK